MKKIFLESHNIKNPFTGFGQFNAALVNAFYELNDSELKFIIHTQHVYSILREYKLFFNVKRYFGFRRYKRFRIARGFDLWHSMNQNTKIEPKNKTPYVLTIHDINHYDEVSSDMSHPANIRFKEKLNRASAITYISEFAKKSTHKIFEVPNVPEYVIYNGNTIINPLPDNKYIPQFNSESPYIFTIGQITERKNNHVLVQMLSQLKNYHLVIAGDTNTKYFNEVFMVEVEKLNISDRVHTLGKVSENEKKHLYLNCAAFAFPSLREGFGIPAIEAMTYGKPIFLANNTSLPEIGGEHSFFWNNFETEYMANVFITGMKKYEEEKEFYDKWYKERAALFTWKKAAEAYCEVYKKVLFST